jgi:hypothetical protein
MKTIFINFLKNKYFLIWIIFFALVLYFAFNPLLSFKLEYMNDRNITDVVYIFYVFTLPITFYEMGFVTCIILDLCFISILSYIIVNFINYFFIESISSTLTRIKRSEWIKQVFSINFIFSLVISVFYILFFIILCFKNKISIDLETDILIVISYKTLLTILIPNIYLLLYIKTNSSIISLGFSSLFYILLELIIKITFVETSLTFKYSMFVYIFIIIIYLLIYKLTEIGFKRRDV